ncbi:MAG: Gfo/Idh/MocA family oxidoreductase [Candidatus Omnitrophica bacterium]|nr:Gfo/Idh/MocA family oxidoreductase [Candidatus Omnitrophota bacterium]
MTRRKIRFGIIGCGLMGREFASAAARWCHLLDLEVEPEIVALCSGHESSFEWFQKNLSTIEQTSTDYRELLANNSIEAIYCAVHHHLHERMYVDTIEAGKHLLGEKPIGIDKAANETILEAVERHPELVVRCTSQFPYYPGAQRIVDFGRMKKFGDLIEVEVGFQHSSDLNPDKPINWKRVIATNGEYGCMGDLGLHVLHIPFRLGWFPHNVRAILSNIVPSRPNAEGESVPCETWDNATLLCETASDSSSFPMTVRIQRIAPGEMNSWYLSVKGTQLSARFSTKHPRTLETMPYVSGEAQTWRSEDLGSASVYRSITGGIFEFGFSDSILQMMAAFCDQVHRGPDAELPFGCATPEETRLQHSLFSAALESHHEKKVVAL